MIAREKFQGYGTTPKLFPVAGEMEGQLLKVQESGARCVGA